LGRILPADGTKGPFKVHNRNSQEIDRKLLEKDGGVTKMDPLSHETISQIFSEQLRRLPLKGGDEIRQP